MQIVAVCGKSAWREKSDYYVTRALEGQILGYEQIC